MKKILILFFQFNLIQVYSQCPTSITLPTGNLTTLLSQSGSWIKTTSSLTLTTTSNVTSIVKMDANPTSGYVELNPGFIAFPTTGAFVAQALDGCGALTPSKMVPNNNLVNFSKDNIKIYPNPSKDVFFIKIDNISVGFIDVYNILGMKIIGQKFETNSTNEINLEKFSSQVFIVTITSNEQIFSFRIVKN